MYQNSALTKNILHGHHNKRNNIAKSAKLGLATVWDEYFFWDRIRIRIYSEITLSTEYEYEYIREQNFIYSNIRIFE